jgi:hypothetical protein
MPISIVQATTVPDAFSGSFGSPVTAGNAVFIIPVTFSASNVMISSSAPKFAGALASGSEILTGSGVQSAYNGGATVYTAVWMLPNLGGGSASVGLTVTNGALNSAVGLLLYEVAGLGAAPVVDQRSSGSDVSTAVSSGATGNTVVPAELVLGAVATLNAMPLPGAPWTSQGITSGFSAISGYQIQSAAGNSYTFSGTSGGAGVWAAGAVTVAPGTGALSGNQQTPGRSMLKKWLMYEDLM